MKQQEAINYLSNITGRPTTVVQRDLAILKRMKEDVAYFAKVCFTKGEGWLYEPGELAKYQRDIYRLIEQKHEKTLVLVPRGHNKTTLISKIYVLHQVLFRHVEYVVLFSSTEKNKRGVASNHRQVFEDAFRFDELHYFLPYLMGGRKPIVKANETELVFANGARIEYVAIFGESRGLSSAGRPDLIVMDDVIPSDARYSETIREQVTDTWFSVIRFIGRQGARFLGVGTVIHKDDLWSKISDERIGGWVHVRLRAYDPDVPDSEKNSTILWPERWSWEKLEKMYREEYVADNKEHLWGAEMLNDPATSSTNPFIDTTYNYYSVRKDDGKVIYEGQAISPLSMYRIIWVDHSQGTGNDDFVVIELGVDWRGFLYVLRLYKSPTTTVADRLKVVRTFLAHRKPHKFGIERTSESLTFINVMIDDLRRNGFTQRPETPTPQSEGSKNDRIHDRLLPKYAAGKIVHPDGPQMRELISGPLEDQLRRFDKTRKHNRDDIIDCLAWAVSRAKIPSPDQLDVVIPNDALYNARVRIKKTIEEQQRRLRYAGEPEYDYEESESPWPFIRGAA